MRSGESDKLWSHVIQLLFYMDILGDHVLLKLGNKISDTQKMLQTAYWDKALTQAQTFW